MQSTNAHPLYSLMDKLISYDGKLTREYNFKIRENKDCGTLIITVKNPTKDEAKNARAVLRLT